MLRSLSYKGEFISRSRCCVSGERKIINVCQNHELRTLALLDNTHNKPSFSISVSVLSVEHSEGAMLQYSSKSRSKASSTLPSVPSCSHCWNLRKQVWYDGNRLGMYCQRTP